MNNRQALRGHASATCLEEMDSCRVQLLPLPIDTQDLSGDHTWLATPVPIPNTAVKQPGPMVVRIARE